jgi:hypothetical protein
MPREKQRVRLEDGLKLDLNRLIRQGFGRPGTNPRTDGIRWTCVNTGKEVACGAIHITKDGEDRGCLRIVMAKLDQRIELVAQPRHFGGQHWYFKCPVTHRNCSVLWLPPGATRFCSRQAWGQQVAYGSQFESPWDRAISGREKVMSRLIGNLDPRIYYLPPKPKWMRWNTYDRLAQKYRMYQAFINKDIADFLSRNACS